MTSVDERETPQSQSDLEDAYTDSDYSPGSLMIDIGTDDVPSSVPSTPPSAAALSSPTTNRGRRSSARRRYNTEANRVVFNGIRLLGQMNVVQAGHPKPLDTIYLYAYGWGDFFLDVIARHSDSIIPVKNLYEKVIPGLKRNVLSARISKLQVKSEALMEPYITALKKLGLVVTGASHFVGIVDFIKICKYFKTPPPDNLTKFYAINSEVNPDDVLRSFSAARGDLQVQSVQLSPMLSSAVRDQLPGSSGVSYGMDLLSDLSPPTGGDVDIRRVVLPGGKQLAVVVRNGEAYILKVELAKILPSHSRDVLETIRRTYSIAVQHANKMEISALKSMGAVGGKAGRSALFSASDVCRMFEHWKARVPLALRQLAEGKLPEDKVDATLASPSLAQQHIPTSSASLSPYTISPYDFSADHLQPSLSPFDITSALPNSSTPSTFPPSQSPFHPPSPLDLPAFNSPQPLQNPQQTPALPPNTFTPPLSQSFVAGPLPAAAPPLSHPPSTLPTSTSFVGSSLTPDRLQQPIQLLNSLQQSSISPTPPPPHYSTSAQPPPHYSTFPPPSHPLSREEQKGKLGQFMSPSGTKLELGTRNGTPLRRRSSSGPPLDDQGLEYSTMIWGDETMTLLCPIGGEEPYLAIPELVNKVFHNRSFVSPQQRSELGITTIPATSLQVYALRAKGSIDNYTGNIKLITISGAVKLAAVSNIQIPGTVIQALKKYCKEPLESLITPAGFAPATRPPSSQPSHSQPSEPQPSHSQPRSTKGGKTVPDSPRADGAPWNDDSAANVWPSKGVPMHPDVIDPGPHFANTADGTYCLVNWEKDKLAVLISSQKVHYMGLYQVFHTLFKLYATRMNFKMRMRKLEIKSIRAASSVRQMLINLDALPQSSPVCGLIRVSEVERLARSYGVEPPQVLYDVFLLRHSNQQKLPNSARPVPQPDRDSSRKALVRKAHGPARMSQGASVPAETPLPTGTYQEAKEMQSLLQQASQMMSLQHPSSTSDPLSSSTQQAQYRDAQMLAYPSSSSTFSSALTTMSYHSSQMPSTVITTATSDKDALIVSVPRNLLTSHFRLVSRPVAPPGIMASLHFHSSASSAPPFRGSMLQSLAKKISQKSKKLGAGSTRHCPKCHRVNPPAKKRCAYCEEFLVGRACPACGTLNHNRTRECFKCKATIAIGGPGGQISEGHVPFSHHPLYVRSFSSQQGSDSLAHGFPTPGSPSNDGDLSTSPKSPLSPSFSAPPIRHAALKSMFPQEAPKGEETHVITKTMYSGNLSSSRKCLECGQLNSKMAKKCLQCRSPLQGRSCPKCGRPNHNHSPECYKCGHQLPSTATKWVYVGSHSGRAYKTQDSTTSSLNSSLKYRAPISCLRCERLRNNGKFVCGRCGDMYWTKPIVPAPGEEGDGGHQCSGHGKKKKGITEPNWNVPSEQDPEVLQLFAQNLLTLDIGDQLLTVVNEAESYARERVYKAEEELEGMEEEYQSSARKREQSENVLNDARAELSALIAEVERQQQKLTHLNEREEEAKHIVETHPGKIGHLEEKIDSALHLFTPATPQSDSMDCSH